MQIGMQYQSPLFTHLGGNANNGANAGAFYWNVNNSSSNSNRNIGAHVNPPRYKDTGSWALAQISSHNSLVEQSNDWAGGFRT